MWWLCQCPRDQGRLDTPPHASPISHGSTPRTRIALCGCCCCCCGGGGSGGGGGSSVAVVVFVVVVVIVVAAVLLLFKWLNAKDIDFGLSLSLSLSILSFFPFANTDKFFILRFSILEVEVVEEAEEDDARELIVFVELVLGLNGDDEEAIVREEEEEVVEERGGGEGERYTFVSFITIFILLFSS